MLSLLSVSLLWLLLLPLLAPLSLAYCLNSSSSRITDADEDAPAAELSVAKEDTERLLFNVNPEKWTEPCMDPEPADHVEQVCSEGEWAMSIELLLAIDMAGDSAGTVSQLPLD